MARRSARCCCRCAALPHRLDGPQVALLGVCLAETVFFVTYLALYGAPGQATISDTLFAHPEYKAVLTVLLMLRLLGSTLFLLRFRNQQPDMEVAGVMGIMLAGAGWMLLIFVPEMPGHFIGVGVFCVGSFLYSLALIRLASTNPNDRQELETLRAGLEWFLLLAVLALVIAFVSLWLEEQADEAGTYHAARVRKAFIVEHAAYLTHLAFYAVFFLYHSPDPTLSHRAYYNQRRGGTHEPYVVAMGPEQDADAAEAGGVPMQCRPLLAQPQPAARLPAILESMIMMPGHAAGV